MSPTLALARALIERPSVTPDDAGCQALIGARLTALGFRLETLTFGAVTNLWAVHGHQGPLAVFAGHTDVVPTGPEDAWRSAPFVPSIRDGRLYGRGSADMKGSLAAMVTAIEAFLGRHPEPRGRIGLLLTSDEEGPAVDGTARVVETLVQRGEIPDWCIVGEPTSERALGDMVKNGRRGSLSGTLKVHGVQGHVAYPHKAANPVHLTAPALATLVAERWDEGSTDFPPTSFQISNIHAGTGAGNVIPGTMTVQFNFRFNPASPADTLRQRTEEVLVHHGLDFSIDWTLGAEPFLTPKGLLVDAVRKAVREITGREAACSTTGGTSDARFLARHCAQVVELGPVNASIHQVDEWVSVDELDQLAAVYDRVLEHLLG
ncbi:succinyl-diaminopimelate desuccinylase [Candidatus Macondimonas diazotrophica]|jgi:succinyl-diaminopimelate desuccinylase|uniref:Succinyl-diaminopimelate desuccinylase n=1 Tax=Candidatus Macondimonas diazotrophica TaxID=2305248 RepID=A0A4Z0FA04_9GAMM|nr:succinyl-diaminopimelate desuccinylase [Candidatus Macondimonas diazotrophica]NCU00926.1 succinyl-diaminopimelate desuccinylase [Candidatus Macondimonas diazotrophica]TFZ83248.1 succinyl-diaminopimelate desuccinylase [Candidatus Macondimonas diazotrophica]HBG50210.1 succinyl-diaminopimelate desuccinylase [Gammaproteobacteria bacterium]HCO44250.1 succinyl-diaminopimelate desuccinylase [Gammaproteobacteria bacterium]